MRRRSFSRYGVTLLELLVVIVIVAILTGLLLVAVQYSRTAARRTACRANLRQLSFAMRMYVEARRDFPKDATPGNAGGWSVALVPFLGEAALADALTANSSLTPPQISPLALVRPSLFSCPSVFEEALSGKIPRAHYAFNYQSGSSRRRELDWSVSDVSVDSAELWLTGPLGRGPGGIGPHGGYFNAANREGATYSRSPSQ